MEITYRVNAELTASAVINVFRQSGIRRPVEDAGRIQRMLDGANLTITAWDGERLVGIARALTDFSYCCYLSDLAVVREYQRAGIGKELVGRVREEIGEECMLLLLAAPEAMGYYPKIGFEKVENGFLMRRGR